MLSLANCTNFAHHATKIDYSVTVPDGSFVQRFSADGQRSGGACHSRAFLLGSFISSTFTLMVGNTIDAGVAGGHFHSLYI